MNRIKNQFKQMSLFKKTLSILGLIMGVIISHLIIFLSVFRLLKALGFIKADKMFDFMLNSSLGFWIYVGLGVFLVILVILIIIRMDKLNYAGSEDKRGVSVMEKGTFGTSHWASLKELYEKYTIDNIANTSTTIYGQLTEKGEQIVGYKKKLKGAEGNRNTLVLASAGSGKSYSYVMSEFLQAFKRGESIVVTDPSMELYTNLSHRARIGGAIVKVINFNTKNIEHTDGWDMLSTTISPETERIDETRLTTFINIYMANSGMEDDYWQKQAKNLLFALISYTSYTQEEEKNKYYKKLFKRVCNFDLDEDEVKYINEQTNEFYSFKEFKEKTLLAGEKRNIDKARILQAFEKIDEYAKKTNPFTIDKLYKNIINFADVEKEMLKVPSWHTTHASAVFYNSIGKPENKASVLSNVVTVFQLFKAPELRHAVSINGLDTRLVNEKQTVLFVISDDSPDNTTKPIASVFFSFLFTDMIENYKEKQIIAEATNSKNPCIPVTLLLDEFFSLGRIGSTDSTFATIMSNSRKQKLQVSIILQVYSQLESIYGQYNKDVIQGNCQTTVYLGGNDNSTVEFISRLSGKASVLNESHEVATSLIGTRVNGLYSSSAVERDLLTEGEARMVEDKVLLFKKGANPTELNLFPWIDHPDYQLCKKVSIFDTIPSLVEILKKNERTEDDELKLNSLIDNIRTKNYNYETGEIDILDVSNDFEQ